MPLFVILEYIPKVWLAHRAQANGVGSGFARARAEAGAGQTEPGAESRRRGILGEGLSPVLSSVLAALLQYAADPQDKHWLTEQQHMRAIGGKMVSTAGDRARCRARQWWQEDRQGMGTQCCHPTGLGWGPGGTAGSHRDSSGWEVWPCPGCPWQAP